ncbi:hypothetical protein PAPYR_1631 [Paratrimastix pyriformis]|uniref:Uncharacterized protein n=1 Tax=Paratrimastix pyriformis TaxID=342808 RepID=A0ABQ8UU30_9EUKA|nr:hypothetical protein PAPYR_1631 [Paratrimastix pyriformis]
MASGNVSAGFMISCSISHVPLLLSVIALKMHGNPDLGGKFQCLDTHTQRSVAPKVLRDAVIPPPRQHQAAFGRPFVSLAPEPARNLYLMAPFCEAGTLVDCIADLLHG